MLLADLIEYDRMSLEIFSILLRNYQLRTKNFVCDMFTISHSNEYTINWMILNQDLVNFPISMKTYFFSKTWKNQLFFQIINSHLGLNHSSKSMQLASCTVGQ